MLLIVEIYVKEKEVVEVNKKAVLYLLATAMFIMPIVSLEDIVPWVVAIFFINKSFKAFKANGTIKPVAIYTLYCGGIILAYNLATLYVESIVVKLWF